LERTLERLAVAVETQNAILFEFMRRWNYYQFEPPELRYDRDAQTPDSIETWVRDAEFLLGYVDMHGNRVDVDDRGDE
jgi:hypothetical protein